MRSGIIGLLLALAPRPGQAEEPAPRSLLPTVVTCPVGSVSTRFTPGLRNSAAHDVTLASRSAYDNCVTLFGEPVTAAAVLEQRSLRGQGCGFLRTGPARLAVTWDTGEQSLLELSLQAVDVQGLFSVEAYNGKVTEGKYRGAHVVRTITYLNTDFASGCMSVGGLTEAHGFSNLVLTVM